MNKDFKNNFRQISNLLFVFSMIFGSYITKILDTGVSIAEASRLFPFPLLPANYAFAIWGLLFPALIGYAIFQILPFSNNQLLEKIGFKTATGFCTITIWIILTQLYDIHEMDFIFSISALSCLLWVMLIFNIYYSNFCLSEYILVYIPISMLAGWMTVASLLTISSALQYGFFDNLGMSENLISIILLLLSTTFVLFVFLKSKGNIFYILPVIWGFVAIWQTSSEPWSSNSIGVCSLACSAALAVVLISKAYKGRNKKIFKTK